MTPRERLHSLLASRHTCALLLPPSLAVLITTTLAVIRPVEGLSRQYLFLTPTLLYLYYYPSGPFIVQVESAFLVFLGSLFSIGWINLFLYFTTLANSRHGRGSVDGRAASAIGLVLLACMSGYIRSRTPRLTNVARIAVFQAIFLLTQDPAALEMNASTFFDFFYPSLFAALASLVSSAASHMVLPVRRTSLEVAIADVLQAVQCRVAEQVGQIVDTIGAGSSSSSSSTAVASLQHDQAPATARVEPQPAIRALCSLFNDERHTISLSCLPATSLKPVVNLLQDRIGRNPICRRQPFEMPEPRNELSARESAGVSSRSPLASPGIARTMGASVTALSGHMTSAIAYAEQGLADAHGWTDNRRSMDIRRRAHPNGNEVTPVDGVTTVISGHSAASRFSLRDIHERRGALELAIVRFEDDLQPWLDAELQDTVKRAERERADIRVGCTTKAGHSSQRLFRRKTDSQLACAIVALLDLARDMLEMLDLVQAQVIMAENVAPRGSGRRRRTLHFPKLGSLWLARQLESERWHPHHLAEDQEEHEANLTEDQAGVQEAEQNRLELTRSLSRHRSRRSSSEKDQTGSTYRMPWHKRLEHSWRSSWDSTTSLDGRKRLSHRLTALKHSRHVKYAFKMGLGIALLSIPAFLPGDSEGRQWFAFVRGQWAITSYMYVLDTVEGATLRVGFYRLLGTISGAIMGYVSFVISRSNAYGIVVMMVLCNLPISYLILRTKYASLGTVIGITLPPTILLPYSGLQAGVKPVILALLRAQDVAIGIVGAILVSMYVYPAHARKRYKEVASKALDDLGLLYMIMSKDNLRHSLQYTASLHSYGTLERRIEHRIDQCRSYAAIQHVEPSLLPKPHGLHTRLNDTMLRVFELLLEIRVLRVGLPRQETVLEVLALRKDLVSAIFIAIFAVAHSIRSNKPMPQFTPNPMAVLQDLGRAIDEHLTQSRPSTPASSVSRGVSGNRSPAPRINLGTLYAYAEREALTKLCQAIAELLEIGRQFLGVQTFYFQEDSL